MEEEGGVAEYLEGGRTRVTERWTQRRAGVKRKKEMNRKNCSGAGSAVLACVRLGSAARRCP